MHIFITAEAYTNTEADCGDINGRVGSENYYIEDAENLPERVVLDTQKNSHGEAFVNVLMDCKFCILNGRITPQHNFASVSLKGKAVVDYFAVPHSCLQNCRTCQVRRIRFAKQV